MKPGKVYLVGAGPGDPGLLTVRGLQLLHSAQVVVYDQLVNPVVLEEVSTVAIRIFVGKQAGRHCIVQEEINRVLVEYARLGYEVVPGVSSAIAVPAYAGIPLTHRKYSSSFAVVTGHEARKAKSTVDWAKLATAVDTLVILMGLHNLSTIVAKLITHGRAPETPAAVIRWGTTQEQETVIGTLADIVEKSVSLKAPALIVVGEVVELRNQLNWFAADAESPEEPWSSGKEDFVNL